MITPNEFKKMLHVICLVGKLQNLTENFNQNSTFSYSSVRDINIINEKIWNLPFSKIYTTYDLLLHGHSGFTHAIPDVVGVWSCCRPAPSWDTVPWSPSLGWLGESSWWFQPRKVWSKSQNGHLAPSEIHQKNWKPPSNAFSGCFFCMSNSFCWMFFGLRCFEF